MKNETIKRTSGARRGEEGYTLLELLVVLAILGLLAAIATPQVLKYLDNAKFSTAKTQVDNLTLAADLFRFDVGRYPTTEEGLDSLAAAPPGIENWNGPYIARGASLTDPWGNAYRYRSPGEHGPFDIFSYGASDGGEGNGTEPPIRNW